MNSRLTHDFRACFARLPNHIQDQARRAYRIWQQDPFHRSLRFKKIHGFDNLHSVRVGIGWRALGRLDGDTITWFWIGSHAEYDQFVG